MGEVLWHFSGSQNSDCTAEGQDQAWHFLSPGVEQELCQDPATDFHSLFALQCSISPVPGEIKCKLILTLQDGSTEANSCWEKLPLQVTVPKGEQPHLAWAETPQICRAGWWSGVWGIFQLENWVKSIYTCDCSAVQCWFHSQNHSKSWQNTLREEKLWLDSLSPLLAFPMRLYPRAAACETLLTILSLPSGKDKDLKSNGINSRADFSLHLISRWNLQQNSEILKDHFKQRPNPWLLSGFSKVHRCLHVSRNLVLQWLPV